nr:F-box domain, leucine-rich repeat domain, L domain-like protein [Tanacetum cinerariifolium]
MPLGDHATHWSSYIEKVIRGVPLYYLSWLKVPKERKAALITDIGEEMRRLEAMGTYIDDEINRLGRGGKQRGHIAGVGRVLPARATASPSMPAHDSILNGLHKKVDFMMSISKSDSKYLDMFSQFESGGASGSGGCEDEEEGADHQDDEDEDGDGDA